jgi:hypothetical protein
MDQSIHSMQHSPTTDPAGLSSLLIATKIKKRAQSEDVLSKVKEQENLSENTKC